MLVEIQALVSQSSYVTPKRSVVGWDGNRLSMILAILESRAGLNMAGNDVYLNVAGGLKISEPACELACAAALISAITNRPLPKDSFFFGEIGLSGEIRPASQTELRLKEAVKLRFKNGYTSKPHKKTEWGNLKNVVEIKDVSHLCSILRDV